MMRLQALSLPGTTVDGQYLGLMLDVGLFDPMITRLLRLVKGDPVKVALATAVLTMAVSLDGDGATTFLITVSAMLPLYQRLGMSRLVLSGIVALGAGVMNIIPWGGPTVRAMAALKADASVIFNPVVPAMVAGIAWVLFVAFMMGRREKRRLAIHSLPETESNSSPEAASVGAAAVPPGVASNAYPTGMMKLTVHSMPMVASGGLPWKSPGCSGSTRP